MAQDSAITRQSELKAVDLLTKREREVFAHLGMGLTNREIAEELDLSSKTVEWHAASISLKIGVKGRGKLVRVAIRAGLSPL